MINHRITNLRDQSDLNTPILGAYEHGSTRWVLLSPSSAGRVPDFHYLFQSDCGSSYRFEWRGYWHVWRRKPECGNIGHPFRACPRGCCGWTGPVSPARNPHPDIQGNPNTRNREPQHLKQLLIRRELCVELRSST